MKRLSVATRKLLVFILLCLALVLCFIFGFVVSETRMLSEINELLQNNIRLQVTVNIYQYNYGELTERDMSAYLEKDEKSVIQNTKGRIGPI
jgi:predicted PurR-regulated permease PerM